MGVAIHVARAKDEASPELEGILAGAVLPVAGGPRPRSGPGVVAAEEMEQRSRSQAHDVERDAGLLTEEAGVMPVAEPDGRETRAFLPEGWLMLAQLRHLLAAENSAVVAQEDNDCGAAGPQRAEPDRVAFGVGQDDPRQLLAKRLLHGEAFLDSPGGLSSEPLRQG